MEEIQISSILRPQRKGIQPKVPHTDHFSQLNGLCAFTMVMSEMVNRTKLVCESCLQCEEILPTDVPPNVLGLDHTIATRRREWANTIAGVNALHRAIQQETSPEPLRILTQAQLVLCRLSFLGMVEVYRLSRKMLALCDRPITEEVIKRVFGELEEELRQQTVKLVQEYPPIRAAVEGAGIDVKAAFQGGEPLSWSLLLPNLLEQFANVLLIIWLLSFIFMAVKAWPDITRLLPVIVLFFVMFLAIGFLLQRAEILRQPRMTQHTRPSPHDCMICSADLFDFAPEDPDSSGETQDQTLSVPV